MGAGLSSRNLGPARSAAPRGARLVAGRWRGGSVRRCRFPGRDAVDRQIPHGSGPPDRGRRVVAHCRDANPRWIADRHQVAGLVAEACRRSLAVLPGAAAASPGAADYRNVAGHQGAEHHLGAGQHLGAWHHPGEGHPSEGHPSVGHSDASRPALHEGSVPVGCAGPARSPRSSLREWDGEAPPRCLEAA